MDKESFLKKESRAGILLILTLFAISFMTGSGNAAYNEDTVFNKSDCQVELPYGFTDNGNGRAIWTYGELSSGSGEYVKAHRLYCYYESQSTGGRANCEVHLYELSEERIKELFSASPECRSVKPDWMGGWCKTLESTDDRTVLLCGMPGSDPDDPGFHEMVGTIRYRNATIKIRVESDGSEDVVKSVFAALEKHAKELIGGNDFQLLYEPPFPYLAVAESISSPDAMKGGELRAILKDENGKGVSGEIVHFYIETGSSLHGTIAETPGIGPTSEPWIDIYPYLDDANHLSYIGYAETDSEGIARLNYILRGLVRSEILADNLVKNGGKVEGTIKAVVVKKESVRGTDSWEQIWKVENSASVPAKFECLAKIVDIWGNGVPDSPPEGQLQYVVSGPGQVRVHRSLVYPTRGTDQSVEEGFELMPGDIINIDGDTGIEVVWVNGDRIRMIVPKYDGVKEKQLVCSVNMLLCSDAYRSDFYTDFDKLSKAFAGVIYEEGTKTLIDTGKSFVPGAQTVSTGFSHIINIMKKSDEQYGRIDLSKFSIITKIRVRSKIIVDATGENIEIYILEGNPDILTVKGDEVTLTGGQMVSIADDGTLSEVQSFDTETALNEFYETTSDTTDLTGLEFESRSKPAGSTIQIPLTLNGVDDKIGNIDLTLNYDPSVLEATEVIKGGLTTDSLFDYNIMDGIIKISLADKQGFSGDGSIAYVKFDVTGSEGSSSNLAITAMTANRADNYETLEIETHDGMFNVISIEEGMGDSDGDGVYTALDALYALQMAVEKIPEDPSLDVNEDESVTSLDARSILKMAVE